MAGGREAIIMDVYEAVTSRRAVRGFAVRGFKDGELRPYGPRPARRDGHVRRRLAANPPIDHCPVSQDSSLHLLTAASGTFETCRLAVTMSASGGIPEEVDRLQKRRS